MEATLLPQSYEELLADKDLKPFALAQGWLREDLQIALLTDGEGNPICYQPGKVPTTPLDWEEETPISHLLGTNLEETHFLFSQFDWEPYQF